MKEAAPLVPLAHSISAACTRLSIGKTSLYALIAAGEIKTIPSVSGRHQLVPESELVKWVESRLNDQKAA